MLYEGPGLSTERETFPFPPPRTGLRKLPAGWSLCGCYLFTVSVRPYVKRFAYMLSDRRLSVCLSCNVGELWPYGTDQDATWYASKHRPRRHCVRWGPIPHGKGHSSPPLFGPLCSGTVAHLSNCWALVNSGVLFMRLALAMQRLAIPCCCWALVLGLQHSCCACA